MNESREIVNVNCGTRPGNCREKSARGLQIEGVGPECECGNRPVLNGGNRPVLNCGNRPVLNGGARPVMAARGLVNVGTRPVIVAHRPIFTS